jgi:hypothetical protein
VTRIEAIENEQRVETGFVVDASNGNGDRLRTCMTAHGEDRHVFILYHPLFILCSSTFILYAPSIHPEFRYTPSSR